MRLPTFYEQNLIPNLGSLFIVFSSYFLNLMQDYYFSEKEKRKFEEKVRIPDESFNRPFQTFSKS